MTKRKFSKKRIYYESIDSTNEEMQRIIQKSDIEEGTVILTGFQTSGKGHMGNTWESEPGKNLLMSMLFLPDFLRPEYQFYLSRIVSLALLELIGSYCDNVTVKWPNDMNVKNKKIAGILIENHLKGDKIEKSIAGIGLNVNQEKFSSNIPDPTSLCMETGCHIDMTTLLDKLLDKLEEKYNMLVNNELDVIDRSYHDHLYGFGEIRNFSSRRKKFRAMITGTEPTGELILETEKGEILKFGFKEVVFS
jgi:BirA family biotin operon repressor/biotin-[acetyl-CoA-carboxylase] ligase